jgi:hypothetical protein
MATHTRCRHPLSESASSFVPTRLLDVSNESIRLIESEHEISGDGDRKFVALSHCWGLLPVIRTLKENYEAHCEAIVPEQLSKTFREAMHATRKLGYRYIWIDSLCIIQDDGEDWAKEAATMCDVYQSATLTLVAAHASGGDVGCFAERDGLLQIPFYLELPQTTANKEPTKLQFTSYACASVLGGGDSPLFGRAWVLQEQILSPRMLIFDGTRLSWQCLTTHGSEKSPKEGTIKQAHQAIRNGILNNQDYFAVPKEGVVKLEDPVFWANLQHQSWYMLVMDYTHRGMTKPKDRLAALAGIAAVLSRRTSNKYYAGLWSQHFTTGLLWGISHNQKAELFSVKGFDVEQSNSSRHEQELAPSWSWASVTVPITYATVHLFGIDRVCENLGVSVSGSIDKQAGRVQLRGHVRRGYLNPIYSHYIREAFIKLPHMTAPPPTGQMGHEFLNFRGRIFHPLQYFLFSGTHPASALKDTSTCDVTKTGSFRLMRGSFQPDELIPPCTEITFIAIAQQHRGSQLTSVLETHDEDAALRVHTLALVPTGQKPGEYRRVGLAVWEQCAWYGYMCGWKDGRDRRVHRLGNYIGNGYFQPDTWWDWLARKLWWDDLEMHKERKMGTHGHRYEKDVLPNFGMYHASVKVHEEVLEIK